MKKKILISSGGSGGHVIPATIFYEHLKNKFDIFFTVDKRGAKFLNLEKYNRIFLEVFELDEEQLNELLMYQSVPTWDSVGHMGMIAALEDAFGIMMETEDIIEFGSYTIGIEKLKKYGVEM